MATLYTLQKSSYYMMGVFVCNFKFKKYFYNQVWLYIFMSDISRELSYFLKNKNYLKSFSCKITRTPPFYTWKQRHPVPIQKDSTIMRRR